MQKKKFDLFWRPVMVTEIGQFPSVVSSLGPEILNYFSFKHDDITNGYRILKGFAENDTQWKLSKFKLGFASTTLQG